MVGGPLSDLFCAGEEKNRRRRRRGARHSQKPCDFAGSQFAVPQLHPIPELPMRWLDPVAPPTRTSRAALRRRAAARERARLGRDLHDGIMQALITVDMQLETALRNFRGETSALVETIESAQKRLRAEMVSLRALVDRSRSRDVHPAQLTATIDGVVWQFNRSCGISAACLMPPEDVAITLPHRVCSELVSIVREALNNVRRHSGAGNVVVELNCESARFVLSITDDGRGITGTRPPAVVCERVAAIGSQVRLVPVPRGTRLVVTIPREGPWKHRLSSESWWRMIILSFVMV
jgi:signal transduction histidine kinase